MLKDLLKKDTHRTERVGSTIIKILSEYFAKELDFPVGIFVNITSVQVSEDIEHAKIWLAVMPKLQRKEALDFLNNNIYDIQGEINKKMVMRKKPRIRFLIDDREDNADRVEELIKKIHEEDQQK